jgi:hypothetical protein
MAYRRRAADGCVTLLIRISADAVNQHSPPDIAGPVELG